jgi:hypothetical protein
MKTFETDLIMDKDMIFNESIEVKGNITGKDGIRFNLKVVGNINARDIDARDIDAWDINAWNINAWNINTRNINARDINAWNINAWDIDARNIKYYAVCFAYNNIKCESIKGRKDNCKHFVLDGKIEIKDKEEKPQ